MLQFAHQIDRHIGLRVVDVRRLHDAKAVLCGDAARLFSLFVSSVLLPSLVPTNNLVYVGLDGLFDLVGVLVGHDVQVEIACRQRY